MKFRFLVGSLVVSGALMAQQPCGKPDPGVVSRLKEDIGYLASDELGGREPGTEGAQLASEYILKRFENLELEPYSKEGFLQKFPIATDVTFDGRNSMIFNGEELALSKDYYPVQYSSNGEIAGELLYVKYGITAPEKKYDDYKKVKADKANGRVFVMDVSSPDGIHPHSEYLKYHDLGERVTMAKEKGAVAVIFVNLEGSANDINPRFRSIHNKGIPVVFVTNNDIAKKLLKKGDVSIQTSLRENFVDGFNIAAYKDNGAERTIIIGAHYDHLGMGDKGSSLYKGEPAIHNGADDNASGVAALLELALRISNSGGDLQKSNYLFIAFSGEEKGLLGSAYFTDNFKPKEKSFYMINMDMVGRLEEKTLAVNGVGTSPAWEAVLEKVDCGGLKIKTGESGVGPSDHTNFYYLEMPVLHFFTGTHSDYHKPSDDADKINYEGEAIVVNYITNLIAATQPLQEMEYSTTKEQSAMAPKFSVTLGVMPDYMYDGEGMRIDGVTEDKAAANAGLQKGDIVTLLGEVKVVDMMSYMKALGQFKKGDSAPIEYLREGKKQKGTVKF